jgi:hypothetical protein
MKKILAALAFALVAVLPVVSQEEEKSSAQVWDHGDNVSSLTYQNVRIYRIYDQKDSYVVLYEKQGLAIGTAVLPKKWVKAEEGEARKLYFRNLPKGLNPYMTVIKQDGSFLKVWMTVPNNRFNTVWAIYPRGKSVDGSDADSLEIEY